MFYLYIKGISPEKTAEPVKPHIKADLFIYFFLLTIFFYVMTTLF